MEGMPMTVRNCRKCGRLFNHVAGMPICPACKEDLEKSFQEVKKYIRENKQADIKEVAEACGVDSGQIQQWIREERLEFTSDSPVKLPCEGCGAPIRSGKFCDKCKNDMAKGLSNAIDKPKATAPAPRPDKSGANRMRFFDR